MILHVWVNGCGKMIHVHIGEAQKLSCARVRSVYDLEPISA